MNKQEASSKIVAERMKKAAGVRTYAELGEIFDGITSQAISSAIRRGKIPDHWFLVMAEKFGVTKEELCQPPQNVTMNLEQSWGDANSDMERERFQQDLDGLFAVVKRWQEEEHGADPLTSMQFIQLFHERIPELGEWIKKQKGTIAENGPQENLSAAGGES